MWKRWPQIGTIWVGMPRKVEISHKTVVFTIFFLVLLWFFVQIAPIILTIFVSVLLMTALNPWVDALVKIRLPRALAIVLVYILLVTIIISGLTSIIPALVDQTTNLANKLPSLLDDLGWWLESIGLSGINGELIASQVSQIGALPANIVKFIISVFSNIVAVLMVLVITFYLLLERKNLDKYLLVLFGEGGEKDAKTFIDKLEIRLGGWVRGELTLMVIIGVMTYIGLVLLGIPYALPLAIIAGILEIVPGIGPVISGVPAVLVALTLSPAMALAVVALYFLIQQLENTIVVPKVMQRATGVNPLITIVAIAIGFRLAGVVGAILAVPIVIVLHVVAVEIFSLKALQKL